MNGAFNMISTLGALLGEMAAGALSTRLSERILLMSFMLAQAAACLLIIGGSKRHVAQVYNRAQ